MKTPKVSVIMPSYNAEKYISKAIESILNQTFTDFEFIILNDGSTDKTPSIIAEYSQKDKRIKFIDNNKNQGFIASLNQCLDTAKGEYIAKMDSDDISLPTRLEKQVAYLDEHQEVGPVGIGYKAFDKGDFEVIHPPVVGLIDFFKTCCTTVFMLRRQIVENNHLRFRKEYLHAEDYDFYTQFIKYAPIHNLQEILYLYRWHGENVSIKYNKIQVENTKKVQKNMLNFLSADSAIQEKLLQIACPKLPKKKKCYIYNLIPLSKKQKGNKTRYYLFHFIPLWKKKKDGKKVRYYLFNFLPVLKRKNKQFFLFFFCPVIPRIKWAIIFNKLPVKKNRVLFWSMAGQGFGDNPKYIALEMLKRKKFELIWLYDKDRLKFKEEFPEEIKLVEWHSLKALYYLATYNIFISNVRQDLLHKDGLKKKKGQIYIHTWHGNFGKKIEADYPKLPEWYVKRAQQDSKDIDYLSSGTKWTEENVFNEKTFWYSGKYFRGGSPRNDILFNLPGKIKDKIYHYFNISSDDKILMYAPTFRDNHNQDVYKIDYVALKKAVESKFGGKWTILSRLHPNMVMEENALPNYSWLKDATKYPDMQELLAISDSLITDYSSSIFDFLITGRPSFIYATDRAYYETTRGFMWKFEDTPFSVASDNQQLIQNILDFDKEKYSKDVQKFMDQVKFYDHGDASKKLVDFILKEGN